MYRRASRVFRECPAIQQRAPRVSGINQRAGTQLKYFGSKAWLAPYMDRLLGDVAVLHSPFFGSGMPFVLSSTTCPRPGSYSGADSITSLCSGKNSSKPELVVHRGNPVASTGMGGAILLPQQDWAEQCCHSRIGWSNPVALTAGRVSGEKKHSVSDTARRWPGDGFFGMKPNSGSDALPIASLPQDFSGKIGAKAKSENRPRCRAKSVFRPRWKNPDLGAGSAGLLWRARPGFYAGQVAR